MQELQVPTQQIPVEIFTNTGERMRGQLFVPDIPQATGPIDHVRRVLADDRLFLPFATEAPESMLVFLGKRHLMRVRIEGVVPADAGTDEESDAEAAGEIRAGDPCGVVLADGTRLDGVVHVDTPWWMSRLVDKLNQAETFLELVTDKGTEFIGTEHVVRVTRG